MQRMQKIRNKTFIILQNWYFMITDIDFYKNVLEHLHEGVYFVDLDRKILYWNKAAENITGYSQSEVLGKRCSDNINHVDDCGIQLCMTTCPLAKTVADSTPREMNLYIRHKKGIVYLSWYVQPLFKTHKARLLARLKYSATTLQSLQSPRRLKNLRKWHCSILSRNWQTGDILSQIYKLS